MAISVKGHSTSALLQCGDILCVLRVWLHVGHRHVIQHLLDLRLEAHVNHSVSLVQNYVGAARQNKIPSDIFVLNSD